MPYFQLLLCLLTMLPEITSALERASQVSTCVEVQDAGTEIVCIALCKPVAMMEYAMMELQQWAERDRLGALRGL